MDANLKMYPILIPPVSNTFYFCHHSTASSQPTPLLSEDDLISTLKPSWSFSNSDLRHLWHSSDSNCLPVPETFQSSSDSKPLPAIYNTTTFHPSTSPNISSKGCSKTSASSEGNLEISSDSAPSDLNSTPTFSRYS